MVVLLPNGPLTVNDTEYDPTVLYVWLMPAAVMLVVPPSPKLQYRFVMKPAEVSVKVTGTEPVPVVGAPLNRATGGKELVTTI